MTEMPRTAIALDTSPAADSPAGGRIFWPMPEQNPKPEFTFDPLMLHVMLQHLDSLLERRLHGEHLSAHDADLHAVKETLAEASRIVRETAAQMQSAQAEMRELRALVKELIEGLLRGRQNGGQ